jgi:hypothetical protein
MRGVVVMLLLAFAGCFFDADYRGGRYTCKDGLCPSGFTCNADQVCIDPRDDASVDDGRSDGPTVDAPPRAATCADPQPFPAAGGSTSGTTTGRSNTVSSMCSGSVMNGADAVYRVDTAAGAQLLVSISGSFAVSAYVIAACNVSPATPACIGTMAATPGNPINVTTSFAGEHFIVVDSANAAANGTYTLTLDVN